MVGVSRRRFLSGAAAVVAAGAAGAAGVAIAGPDGARSTSADAGVEPPGGNGAGSTGSAGHQSPAVPFHGAHQAGITTPQQRHLFFAAFDVATDDRGRLAGLLRDWTAAAAELCAGRYGRALPADEPPPDSGEAAGAGPSRLTVTVGFGATLFQQQGVDRFGLAARRPHRLATLPSFRTDRLLPERSGGDICLQACADDPLVAMHAVRVLRRVAGDAVTMRWTQTGFLGGPPSTSPRNLFGFKDGTANPDVRDGAVADDVVWVGRDDAPWLAGGSYLVARRIHLRVEKWDESALADQEATFGRHKASGAPLGSAAEHDAPDLAARGPDGKPVIPATAHIRLASPANNGGARLLRRGYTFADGDDGAADFESGLFFLAYQRDPVRQFVAIAGRLSESDALNEYVVHTGSGVFACPPGVAPGEWWGQRLFEA